MHAGAKLWAVATVLTFALAAPASAAVTTTGDFDNDGFDDLAIGVPGEDLGPHADNAGAVNVLYGGTTGLTPTDGQLLSQRPASIRDAPNKGDEFGTALASGDFDDDGFDDLAIGVPGEGITDADGGGSFKAGVGIVQILFGSPNGLTGAGDQLFRLDRFVAVNGSEGFGSALAAADFGNGRSADLAIGSPGYNGGGGLLTVLSGSHHGLDDLPLTISAIAGATAGAGNQFGASLAAADFGHSRQADLAVGAPGQNTEAGAVGVISGTAADGLFGGPSVSFTQSDVGGTTETGDRFGASLAAADFGNGARADLAIGAPLENPSGQGIAAGSVSLVYGGAGGLTGVGAQGFDNGDVGGSIELGDRFGSALAAADFGRNAHADLAIGIPGEDIENLGANNAGAVGVLYGGANGLSTFAQLLTQDQLGGDVGVGDSLGAALGAGEFGDGSAADLAIGVPGEDLEGLSDSGEADVVYGRSNGLAVSVRDIWAQGIGGIAGGSEAGDAFGSAFAPANGRTEPTSS